MVNRRGNRTGWMLTALVVLAFVVFKTRMVPNIMVPSTVHPTGNTYTFTAYMKPPAKTGLSWVLSRRADDTQYIVEVFNNQQATRAFTTKRSTTKQLPGQTYPCLGSIKINGTPYQATQLHVNADGRSAAIQLAPAQTAGTTSKSAAQ